MSLIVSSRSSTDLLQPRRDLGRSGRGAPMLCRPRPIANSRWMTRSCRSRPIRSRSSNSARRCWSRRPLATCSARLACSAKLAGSSSSTLGNARQRCRASTPAPARRRCRAAEGNEIGRARAAASPARPAPGRRLRVGRQVGDGRSAVAVGPRCSASDASIGMLAQTAEVDVGARHRAQRQLVGGSPRPRPTRRRHPATSRARSATSWSALVLLRPCRAARR